MRRADEHSLDEVAVAQFVAGISTWWATARVQRDALPWRQRRDPWEVLVAEVMLAQTQATRVALVYSGFLARFPTPAACARASEGDLLRAWSGLGYNRRALNLQRSANLIVERHQGEVPRELPALPRLPGVGPYIARAVMAFAFDEAVGLVEANIGRVLARAVAGRRLRASDAQSLADELVVRDAPRDWNLALMDFGHLLCSARRPSCASCPVAPASLCAWRRAGTLEDPASGSAAVSRRQGPFRGSDREARGRLVRAACSGPLRAGDLAELAGLPGAPDRALQIGRGLASEGLLVERPDGSFVLP